MTTRVQSRHSTASASSVTSDMALKEHVWTIRSRASDAEWEARIELAAFYRIVARYDVTDLTSNHITLKVPNTADQFLIDPYGLSYDEITASSLVKIDAAGEIVMRSEPERGIWHQYHGLRDPRRHSCSAARDRVHTYAHAGGDGGLVAQMRAPAA
jgi:hypothetical protein